MSEIIFTGDLMCHPSMTESTNREYGLIFGDVKGMFQGSDFVVGNLETTVAGEALRYTYERYAFNTPESYVKALREAGFNLLCLANNHIMDRGEEGIINTLENCRRTGIDTIGAYKTETERDKIYVKNISGINVAFVNYTYGTNAFAHHRYLEHKYMINLFQPEECREGSVFLLDSYERIAENTGKIYCEKGAGYQFAEPYVSQLRRDIERAGRAADFVIVIMHSGGQYNDMPDAYTENLVNIIRNAGADLIVGHHPHIIQKSDYRDGVFTAYSLGNFVFSLDDIADINPSPAGGADIDSRYSVLLRLSLQKHGGKVEASYHFDLIKVIEKDGIPTPVNTCFLYQDTKDQDLFSDIRFFVERFTGRQFSGVVKKTYSVTEGQK